MLRCLIVAMPATSSRLTLAALAASSLLSGGMLHAAPAPPPPPPLELPKPPSANVASSEGAVPLPLPVVFQKRQEKKNPPQPPVLLTKIRTADNEDWPSLETGLTDLQGALSELSAAVGTLEHVSPKRNTLRQ